MKLGFSKIILVSVFLLFFFFSASFLFFQGKSFALSHESELYGQAWSENIGWINFNHCTDSESVCPGAVAYSVAVDNQSGLMTGHAWSPTIGWIKFGGLSGFPSGAGTVSDNAELDFETGRITGWVRACATTPTGDCAVEIEIPPSEWDGWISLSGAMHPSPTLNGSGGLTYNESLGKVVGKAWAGPIVGWIDFGDNTENPPNVRVDLPSEEEEEEDFDYALTNSTEGGNTLIIQQGGNGTFEVQVNLLSGDTENVSLSEDGLPLGVTMDGGDNNPCQPNCVSQFELTVGSDVTPREYSFVIMGDPQVDGESRETTIIFEVEGEIDPEPQVSCSADGAFWLFQPITWKVEADEPFDERDVQWQGDLGRKDAEECLGSISCQTSYTTVGPKQVTVSIDGGDNFTACEGISIGVRMWFREI